MTDSMNPPAAALTAEQELVFAASDWMDERAPRWDKGKRAAFLEGVRFGSYAQAKRISAVLRLCAAWEKGRWDGPVPTAIISDIRAALEPPDAEPLRFELRDDCALTLFPSSKEGYETLTLLQGDDALEIQLTPEAKVALAMTVESEPRERVTDAPRYVFKNEIGRLTYESDYEYALRCKAVRESRGDGGKG